ncbi:DivIVA domain-containing protein [Streptomyces sp. NBC_01497]|uniref:DivIVA domain-containing protein n=1 Tax=Streptomyces sp. NBC_01497 TaxID=2903885 RepID=UPI002E35924F|nr:DivIVA domain-containing protein [Streptomyces sp. NBC_01497]
MFWFLLIAMVVVVAAVTMAVLGGGDRAVLPEAEPQRLVDPLPQTRPVGSADIDAMRLPVAVRGYRMAEVDDVLGRLGAELAERDARIAELESALAGARAGAGAGRRQYQQPYQEQGWEPRTCPAPGGPAEQGWDPRTYLASGGPAEQGGSGFADGEGGR